ncbi:MAG TPA: hypothetical protein VJH92_05350 [Candidatus Nanoarchaeia archaeon]|nr:hypothetical protein [Candidatus Nanoarchaeia archaeon]
MKTEEKILVTRSVGLTIGIFMILLELFNGFKIDMIFFFLLLVVVGFVLLTLLGIFERRLKAKK